MNSNARHTGPPIASVHARPFRCICCQVDFDELQASIQKAGWKTAAEVGRETGCGAQCGLCRPYIARMLSDGRVPLLSDLMSPADIARWDVD